jgi:hypothetical protein
MSNICTNTITAIGVQEEPTALVKALSKVMFEIDLDNPNLDWWGLKDKGIDPKSWYKTLTDEYRNEGSYAARFAILYVKEPYSKLGVTAPRFYVETKVAPPFKQIVKASQVFPELTFHVDWWISQEGPTGEFVARSGRIVEEIQRKGSWRLFDSSLLYPRISLLPAHLPYTLAQHGALRLADAIHVIEELRQILDEKKFTESRVKPTATWTKWHKRDKHLTRCWSNLGSPQSNWILTAYSSTTAGVKLFTTRENGRIPNPLEITSDARMRH